MWTYVVVLKKGFELACMQGPRAIPPPAALGLDVPPAQLPMYDASWQPMYSMQDAASCWQHACGVRYGQPVPLDGYCLTATAYPSGSGFGHALWIIRDGTHA